MESHKAWVRTSVRWFAVAAAAGLFADPTLAESLNNLFASLDG